jgi:8-oxo-dGTP diphosphatase
MGDKRFNIRVYGLLINERNEVLLSDERRNGWAFTKFPGGGLDWGEGIPDCLRREFLEELGIEVTIGELFYLTDYFQQSAFDQKDQIISIYYRVHSDATDTYSGGAPDPGTGNYELFRWVAIADLTAESVTFPIDRIVVNKLINP